MKQIALGKDKFALVDDEDFYFLNQFKWHENKGYARTVIYMHNLILKPKDKMLVDHKNRNRLDNERENLRYATHSQSQANRTLQSNNRSGFRGVYWNKGAKKWKVDIKTNGIKKFVGTFTSKIEAAKAYNKACLEIYGQYASLNPVEEI